MRSSGRRLPLVLRAFFYSLGGALLLLSNFPPAQVSAQSSSGYSAEWVDRSHIKVFEAHRSSGDGQIFTDVEPYDNINHYVNLDQREYCRSSLSVPMNSSEQDMESAPAKGILFSVVFAAAGQDTAAQCEVRYDKTGAHAPGELRGNSRVPITPSTASSLRNSTEGPTDSFTKDYGHDITVAAADKGVVNFQRTSETTIATIDGSRDYTRFENSNSYFDQADGDCRDRIVISGVRTIDGRQFEVGSFEERSGSGTCQVNRSTPITIRASGDPDLDDLSAAGLTGSSDQTKATCEGSRFQLSWLFCGIINGLAEASEGIFNNLIKPFLRTTVVNIDDTNDPIYKVWSSFRVIANVLLVLALLVVVLGQSVGGGLIDAYTAKKVLPRLFAAAILINISIYLVAFMVDLTNILGEGVGRLITAPFATGDFLSIEPNFLVQAGGLAAFVGGTWAAIAVGGGALLSFLWVFILLPALFAMIGVFVTLILRQGLILFLIITSPVAFALYCLPNTEKYFKKWWDLLFKALMVYPIIVVLFALAHVLAVTIAGANSTSGGRATLGQIAGIVVMLIPMFLIPFAFKMAGGAVATLFGAINGFGKKGVEAIKGNANDPTSLRRRTQMKMGSQLARKQAGWVDPIRDPSKVGSLSRRTRLIARAADKFGNVDARLARYSKQEAEIGEAMSSTGRDALRYAGGGYMLEAGEIDSKGNPVAARTYYNSKGEPIYPELYKRGKELYGGNLQAIGAQLEYRVRKAQSSDDIREMRFAFAQNAKANNWTGSEMIDVWAQATYPHKDKWLSEWFSMPTPTVGTTAAGGVTFKDVENNPASLDKMVSEQHRAKESFRVSSLRAEDWHAQYNAMMDIQSRLLNPATHASVAPDELSRYARISENLDTMARQGVITQNGDGEVMVSGASAAASGVISAMYKSRRVAAAPLETAPGVFSPGERVLYDVQAADMAKKPAVLPGPGGTTIPGPGLGLSSEQAVQQSRVATADVSQDRTNIPRVVP